MWNQEERNELYREAIATWGVQAQVDMSMEELAEAIVATQKLFRRDYCEKRRHELASEYADVTIMMEEVVAILDRTIPLPKDAPEGAPTFAELVQQQIAFKLDRTRQRLADTHSKLQSKPATHE